MSRFLFLSLFVVSFSFTAAMAMPTEGANHDPYNRKKPDKRQRECPDDAPRGRSPQRESGCENPPKRAKVTNLVALPTFPARLEASPATAERRYFSPIRREFIKRSYAERCNRKGHVSTADARAIYGTHDTGNFFTRAVEFENRHVLQNDSLFQNTKENMVRMKKGLAPVAYNGDEIHIHHIFQKDRGIPKDPLCEMTRRGHMGHNARFIITQDAATGSPCVIHSSLTEKEARQIKCGPNQHSVCNLLHFHTGSSHINRTAFNEFRKNYWMNRAAEVEAGNYVEEIDVEVEPTYIFQAI